MLPAKRALQEELLRLLASELAMAERVQQASLQGATHEEAKPENDKDTRALEQSYLARGQALRVIELRKQVLQVEKMPLRSFAATDRIALGALVLVEEGAHTQALFLAPQGGGRALANGTVQVVTPEAPLGRALLGKGVGDECVVRVADRSRELVVGALH